MAICPMHGGYAGDTCKGCAKSNQDIKELVDASKAPPEIDTTDQLTFERMKNQVLEAQVELTQMLDKINKAQAQLNNFAGVLFEKHKVDPKVYFLNPKTLKFEKQFVAKELSPTQG